MGKQQKTKKSHFVPRFYLKKFLDKNGYLHCYDLKNKKFYKYNNLMQVCQKKNLYLIKNKISNLDKILYLKIFGNTYPEDNDFCNQLVEMLNGTLGNLFSTIAVNNNIERELNKWVLESLNTEDYSRKQETLFTFMENDFQPLYDDIITRGEIQNINYDNDTIKLYLYIKVLKYIHQELYYDLKNIIKTEYKNTNERIPELNLLKEIQSIPNIDIIHYMFNQYFRTEKIISNLKNTISKYKNEFEQFIQTQFPNEKFDMDNLIFLFINIQPIFLIKNIIQDNFRLIVLKNETPTPFIISDNPCINLYAQANKIKYESNELEIYFPLTSKMALLFSKHTNIDEEIEDVNIIDDYNKKIIKNAKRYLYANDVVILQKYENIS